MKDDLNARILGGLFGYAGGDALGSSYEGTCRDEKRDVDMTGGGQFNLKLGEVTDDTLMMLTLREDDTTFGRTTKTPTSLLEQGCTPEVGRIRLSHHVREQNERQCYADHTSRSRDAG